MQLSARDSCKHLVRTGEIELRDIVGDLSGTTLSGAAHYRWEGRPEMSLAIEGPQIDVRTFVPAGASLLDMFNLVAHSEATGGAGQAQSKPIDTLVRINAGQLIAGGRTYRDVALEFDLRGGNLRLPMLRVSGDEGYSLEMEGDRGLLRQVVRKLVDNAVKYSPPGARVAVRGRARGDELALEVEDWGIGIAEEHLPRIFEKFYMVDGGVTRRLGGTGVGLYLVRQIVRLHHGEVDVQSLPGQGSVFSVRLPRRIRPAPSRAALG